ncbi:chloride channel protein [Streptomyces sp. TR06-5]|uniref:chloride channel protein n=1 Tax=unclassified Streptomyces TaxID=2593676 RepID=UPI0039A1E305
MLLALVVGAMAGFGSIAFRWLVDTFTVVFSGHADYAGAGHAAHPQLPALGPWFVLLAPVAGGLLYGPLVHRFAREARGHGVPEVMYAVARKGGRIKPAVAVVKSLASALCIGSGGSVGREGPIVQIGSALGSTLGRVAKVTEGRMRLLVACGAAGGIAATFNAPLAGVFFAMELILRAFTVEAFAAAVLSSVTAAVISRAVLGDVAFLTLPPFHVDHLAQYPLFAVLGAAAGVVGIGFTRILYLVEDACDWAWRGPEWLRPAAGGLLLGTVLLVLPEMYGVGYPVLENAVHGGYAAGFLLLLVVGKMLATSLSIGIGGSGGVFAPSLFIGAALGAAYGAGTQALLPDGIAGAAGAYALVGMGAVFAGSSRAPITAVVILFELTGQYSIILPMMLAIVLATVTSRLLSNDTIYTLKLRRRGIDLNGPPPPVRAANHAVREVMEAAPPHVPADAGLESAARLVNASAHGALPVCDTDGRYLGTLTVRTVADALGDRTGRESAPRTAADVAARPTPVTADTPLPGALTVLAEAPPSGIPVLADASRSSAEADGSASRQVVGWLTHRAALRSVTAAPASTSTPETRTAT